MPVAPAPDQPPLQWYGLQRLGFGEDYFQLTGDRTRDQIQIEALCFRIGHEEHEGGLGRFNHFQRYVDLTWNNPASGSMKRCIWNPWANQMFRKMCEEPELCVAGCTSAGKCLSINDLVLMHDGSTKRAEEVKSGDRLMGDDSNPRVVQEVHSGVGPMFKVTPVHGEPWFCTEDHVLVLKRAITSGKSYRRLGEIIEMPAKDYYVSSGQTRTNYKQFCVGVDFPEKKLELDPRLFGIWLGDGARHRCRISIPRSEPEVFSYVKAWCEHEGYEMREYDHEHLTCPTFAVFPEGDVSAGMSNNPLWRFLKSSMDDMEKRIPRHYLLNSRKNRMLLLAGLIDTDGHAAGTYFEIATKFTGLKDDIAFLARSLGFRVSTVHRMATCQGKQFPSWRITIFGNVVEIPTLRKKCREKKLRQNSDCTGVKLTPAGDMPWVGFSVDGNHRFLLADFTVVHNSDPAALYGVVSYTTDPTHTLVLVMSTSIKEAKKRIWKTVREYWEGIPFLPGKPAWATNEIRGLNYKGDSFGESTGIFLLAAEQGSEKEAVNKLIGMKAPRTGEPDESFDGLMAHPEFADLANHFDEATLRDLVPRLYNISQDRIGKIILIVDEATGVAEAVLTAVKTNLKPGNVGHCQVIYLGNPNLPYDTFGLAAKPEGGWDKVDLIRDEEWRTESGGLCIRFNGEKNPRITEGNDRYSWMLRKTEIDQMEKDYGRDSLFYHRMVLGTWCLTGAGSGIYTPADIELSGARQSPDDVVWGFRPPEKCSFLDPAFTAGGDRAYATFGLCGEDIDGVMRLVRTGGEAVKVNVNDVNVPPSYQIVRGWRAMCIERGIKPENAGYDSTGGGQPFGDIVKVQWSPAVLGITSAGPASKTSTGEKKPGKKPGTTEPVLAHERFANKATELWYGAKKLFRSRQISGVNEELAKELCSRQHAKGSEGDARVLKVEPKKSYKDREGRSPDNADSFLGLVEVAKTRLGLRSTEGEEVAKNNVATSVGRAVWQALREKAKALTNRKTLNKRD